MAMLIHYCTSCGLVATAPEVIASGSCDVCGYALDSDEISS